MTTKNTQYSPIRRLQIVQGYLDNKYLSYKEIAEKIGLTEIQFAAVRKASWWLPAVEEENEKRIKADLRTRPGITTNFDIEKLRDDIAAARNDGTKPSRQETEDFIYGGNNV